MGVLSNEQFLLEAAQLFEKATQSKSSIYITQKRLIEKDEVNGDESVKNETSKFNDTAPVLPTTKIVTASENKYPILIRITDGNSDKSKKVKISSVVKPEELSEFWFKYANIVKSGVSGLKKKDKTKKKKKSTK